MKVARYVIDIGDEDDEKVFRVPPPPLEVPTTVKKEPSDDVFASDDEKEQKKPVGVTKTEEEEERWIPVASPAAQSIKSETSSSSSARHRKPKIASKPTSIQTAMVEPPVRNLAQEVYSELSEHLSDLHAPVPSALSLASTTRSALDTPASLQRSVSAPLNDYIDSDIDLAHSACPLPEYSNTMWEYYVRARETELVTLSLGDMSLSSTNKRRGGAGSMGTLGTRPEPGMPPASMPPPKFNQVYFPASHDDFLLRAAMEYRHPARPHILCRPKACVRGAKCVGITGALASRHLDRNGQIFTGAPLMVYLFPSERETFERTGEVYIEKPRMCLLCARDHVTFMAIFVMPKAYASEEGEMMLPDPSKELSRELSKDASKQGEQKEGEPKTKKEDMMMVCPFYNKVGGDEGYLEEVCLREGKRTGLRNAVASLRKQMLQWYWDKAERVWKIDQTPMKWSASPQDLTAPIDVLKQRLDVHTKPDKKKAQSGPMAAPPSVHVDTVSQQAAMRLAHELTARAIPGSSASGFLNQATKEYRGNLN